MYQFETQPTANYPPEKITRLIEELKTTPDKGNFMRAMQRFDENYVNFIRQGNMSGYGGNQDYGRTLSGGFDPAQTGVQYGAQLGQMSSQYSQQMPTQYSQSMPQQIPQNMYGTSTSQFGANQQFQTQVNSYGSSQGFQTPMQPQQSNPYVQNTQFSASQPAQIDPYQSQDMRPITPNQPTDFRTTYRSTEGTVIPPTSPSKNPIQESSDLRKMKEEMLSRFS